MITFDGSEKIDWSKIGPHNNEVRFIIPINRSTKKWWQFWKKEYGMTSETRESIAELISYYKEDINIDDVTGEINIDGAKPIQKEYWLPTNEK